MIEALLLLGFSALLGGGVWTVWRKGVTSRRFNVNPELEAPEPRPMVLGPPQQRAITASVRAELDTSPDWWDGQFHKALKRSGAPVLAEIEGDIIVEKSLRGDAVVSYEMPGHTVLEGCTCSECKLDIY